MPVDNRTGLSVAAMRSEQRHEVVVAGRHLHRRHQRREHGDAVDIERRRQEHDAGLGGGARQPCVILGRQREAPQLGEARRLVGADQTLRHDGLEFHRLGAGRGREADELLGQADIALVVVADLGNHQHARDRGRRDRSSCAGLRQVGAAAAVMMQHELRLGETEAERLVKPHGRRIGRLRSDPETGGRRWSPTPLTAAKPIIARARPERADRGATAIRSIVSTSPGLQSNCRNPATAPACSATTMPSPRLPAKKLSAHAAFTRWASQRGDCRIEMEATEHESAAGQLLDRGPVLGACEPHAGIAGGCGRRRSFERQRGIDRAEPEVLQQASLRRPDPRRPWLSRTDRRI